MKVYCLRAIAFLYLLSPIPLFAAPPFLTDDPVPTDYQHFELYGYADLSKDNTATNLDGPAFELDYGLIPNVEIDMTIKGTTTWDHQQTNGLGDTAISATYRFIQETQYIPQVAIVPNITFPTGDMNRNLGNGRSTETLPLWAQKSWGDWTLDSGCGYTFNGAPNMLNYFFGGMLIQKELNKKIILGSEIFSQGALSHDQKSTTIFNVGGYYNFSDSFSFLFSAGHSVIGANNLVGFAGLYWTW